jgi:hypothetical protein
MDPKCVEAIREWKNPPSRDLLGHLGLSRILQLLLTLYSSVLANSETYLATTSWHEERPETRSYWIRLARATTTSS